MPNDLEVGLISGGVTPAAAKIIANAIANLASSQVAIGRRYGDATPVDQLRMVDANTRRYVLTNIDQPADEQFAQSLTQRGDKYSPATPRHSYRDSQPATANPTLTTQSVKGAGYVSSTPGTADSVAQSSVGLNVAPRGGQHARLNQATGQIEAVPFLIENDQEQFIEAKFEERPGATVLKLRLRNLDQMFTVTSSHPALINAVITPTATGVALNLLCGDIQPFVDQAAKPFWAWKR
jgi:hypothetical protein